jgi:hypothetical protein
VSVGDGSDASRWRIVLLSPSWQRGCRLSDPASERRNERCGASRGYEDARG